MDLRHLSTPLLRHPNLHYVTALLVLLLIPQKCFSVNEAIMVSQTSQNIVDVPDSYHYPHGVTTPSFYRILGIHSFHDHVLIGGKNSITELRPSDLSLEKRMPVSRSADQREYSCEQIKSEQSEYYCQNYITFVQELNETTSIVCGTNALFPLCITYSNASGEDTMVPWDAVGLTASGPDQQTTTHVLRKGENVEVYSGAPSNLVQQYAISHTTISPTGEKLATVITDTDNPDWIKQNPNPSFIGEPIQYNGKMYFFFREEAVEARNVEKVVYSRVAQVCMNDTGGTSSPLNGKWTTFIKARLGCATQGDYKTYFDNLQGIYRSKDNPDIVFGVFTTPESGVPASALCAYDLREIEQLFAQSKFRRQESKNSFWLSVADNDVPDPRPGDCSRRQPTSNYNSISSFQLMTSLVPNKADYDSPTVSYSRTSDSPILILPGHQFLQLVVQERDASGLEYDVFFFGTSQGHLLKAYIHETEARVVEQVVLKINGSGQEPINVMRMLNNDTAVFVSTSSRIYRVPTANCRRFTTCIECVTGQDPACSWMDGQCKPSTDGIRNMSDGSPTACPMSSSTTTQQTAPATPATRSTESPDSTSSDPESTAEPPQQTTPKSDTITGTTAESMMPTSPPSTTTPLKTPTTPPTTPPPDNSTIPQPGQSTTVCERPQCHSYIVAILFIIFTICLIPGNCALVIIYRKKEKNWCRKRTDSYSPGLHRDRDASQKVPLNSIERLNSMPEDDDDVEDPAPLATVESSNDLPGTLILNTPYKENTGNGQTPSMRRIEDSTLDDSQA